MKRVEISKPGLFFTGFNYDKVHVVAQKEDGMFVVIRPNGEEDWVLTIKIEDKVYTAHQSINARISGKIKLADYRSEGQYNFRFGQGLDQIILTYMDWKSYRRNNRERASIKRDKITLAELKKMYFEIKEVRRSGITGLGEQTKEIIEAFFNVVV